MSEQKQLGIALGVPTTMILLAMAVAALRGPEAASPAKAVTEAHDRFQNSIDTDGANEIPARVDQATASELTSVTSFKPLTIEDNDKSAETTPSSVSSEARKPKPTEGERIADLETAPPQAKLTASNAAVSNSEQISQSAYIEPTSPITTEPALIAPENSEDTTNALARSEPGLIEPLASDALQNAGSSDNLPTVQDDTVASEETLELPSETPEPPSLSDDDIAVNNSTLSDSVVTGDAPELASAPDLEIQGDKNVVSSDPITKQETPVIADANVASAETTPPEAKTEVLSQAVVEKEADRDTGVASETKGNTEKIKPFLGVGIRNPQGNLITTVYVKSTARKVGVKLGDRLLSLNGKKVTNLSSLRAALADLNVSDPISMEILRDGKQLSLGPLPLGTR